MLDLESVLKEESHESDSDDYGYYVDELASALGISKEKAGRVAHAVCMLAGYEMEKGSKGPKVSVTVGG